MLARVGPRGAQPRDGHPRLVRRGLLRSGKNFFYDEDNPEGLQEMYRRWGLGSKTGIDLPSEAAGRVPDSAWKEEYRKDWSADQRAWNAGDMTNIAIGQGDILVTPLQMAVAYCGLAMGGVEWTPHVLLSAVARDGEGDAYAYEPKKRLTAKIETEGAMDVVYRGVHSMIYEESPVTAAHFTNLPVEVAGKSVPARRTARTPTAGSSRTPPSTTPNTWCAPWSSAAATGPRAPCPRCARSWAPCTTHPMTRRTRAATARGR